MNEIEMGYFLKLMVAVGIGIVLALVLIALVVDGVPCWVTDHRVKDEPGKDFVVPLPGAPLRVEERCKCGRVRRIVTRYGHAPAPGPVGHPRGTIQMGKGGRIIPLAIRDLLLQGGYVVPEHDADAVGR